MNPDGAVAEGVAAAAAAAVAVAASSALGWLWTMSRLAVAGVKPLSELYPGHPSVLKRASLLGLSGPSCRSRFSPSCASAWHSLGLDQEAAHNTYSTNTYASRMHCTGFVHHRDLFSIQEFRGCCTSDTCQGGSHAIENNGEREDGGCGRMGPTLRFLYLLFGCPAVADPPAVLVARLVRISSMSCSAVD